MGTTIKRRLGPKMLRMGTRWTWQGVIVGGFVAAARGARRGLRRAS